MREGVDGIGAKARWLNWLCGFRVRRSAGGGRKPHGEGGDWDGGRFFFLWALCTPKRPETQMTDVFGRRTGRKNGDLEVGFFVFALNLICNGQSLKVALGNEIIQHTLNKEVVDNLQP